MRGNRGRGKSKAGVFRHHGAWVVRPRERVFINGEVRKRQRTIIVGEISGSKSRRPPEGVKEEAQRILAECALNSAIPDRNAMLGDFAERVYFPHARACLRPSTAAGYEGMWCRYLSGSCSEWRLREVKTFHIQRVLEDIARTHAISKTTLAHTKHLLSGIFTYATQQGFRDGSNPVELASIPAFAQRGKEGEAYTTAEIEAMLRILPELPATVVATASWTGLRASELRGLTWDCLILSPDDQSMACLEVRRSIWRNHVGEPKTERSKAPVPVVPQLAVRLAAHRRACGNPISGPIFVNGRGNPISLDALYWRQMRDVLKKAGIQWKGWHAFRRGLASNLNRLGIDDSVIQAVLRHSSVAVTQRCYIKTNSEDSVSAMQRLSDEVKRTNRSPLVLQNGESEEKSTIQ